MPIIAGKNLAIYDNSAELTTGVVILESQQIIRSDELLVIIDYPHVGGDTDTGFSFKMASIFQYDPTMLDEYLYSEFDTNGNSAVKTWTYAVGPYKVWDKLPSALVGMQIRMHIQWAGTFTQLPNLKIHLIGNSVSY